MSRNRIKHSQSLHWMSVVKWILILGLMSILGLVYMLGKNQNLHLAEETLRLQDQLDAIEKRNDQLTGDLQRMKSPVALERRLAQMRSTLVWVGNLTVVPMDQSTRMRLARIGTPINHNLDLSRKVGTADETDAPPQPPNP